MRWLNYQRKLRNILFLSKCNKPNPISFKLFLFVLSILFISDRYLYVICIKWCTVLKLVYFQIMKNMNNKMSVLTSVRTYNKITRLHSDGTERSKSISFPFHVRSQNIFIEWEKGWNIWDIRHWILLWQFSSDTECGHGSVQSLKWNFMGGLGTERFTKNYTSTRPSTGSSIKRPTHS